MFVGNGPRFDGVGLRQEVLILRFPPTCFMFIVVFPSVYDVGLDSSQTWLHIVFRIHFVKPYIPVTLNQGLAKSFGNHMSDLHLQSRNYVEESVQKGSCLERGSCSKV